MAAIVAQVLNAKNYFERLQLPVQNYTQDVLKKKYKKLALQIHPDKCSDPKATEAFKSLTEAYEHLSDSNKQYAHINEIKRRQSTSSTGSSNSKNRKRKTNEEEFAEQVRKNKPRPKEPKKEPQQEQQKRKPSTYHTFGFTYKNEETSSNPQPSTSVSCSFCKRSFPTKAMLDRHMMFSDYNHKHPTFKQQQQTPRTTEDPVTQIFDM